MITRTFVYWFKGIYEPRSVFARIKSDPDRLKISLCILIAFGILYSFTALFLYFADVLPVLEPWLPISREKYYLYQTFWTLPWGLATASLMAAAAKFVTMVGHKDAPALGFVDALVVISVAWVIPSFVLMWLPETLIVPFAGGAPWPDWIDLLRLSILAPVWQIGLVFIGMKETYGIGWVRSITIGLVVTSIGFGMFLPFMR